MSSRLYGIKRLSHQDLGSTSDAPGDEFVDRSEVCHNRREKVVGEEKAEDSGKLARQLAMIQLGWRQHHSP